MITMDNLKEVINQISSKDKKRIWSSDKEYCVIELHCFNVGSFTKIKLANNYNRYKNVCRSGNAILSTFEVGAML